MRRAMGPSSLRMMRVRRFSWHCAWIPWLASCVALDADPVSSDAGAALAADAMPGWSDAASAATDANTTTADGAQSGGQSGPDAASGAQPGGGSPAQRSDGGTTATPGAGATGGSTGSIGGGSTTPTCAANVTCTPPDACKTGKTSCSSGLATCYPSGDVSDDTPCSNGICSKGKCCPAGEDWVGDRCSVVCSAGQRLCNLSQSCIGPEQPCNNQCPSGRILCDGVCQLGDCCNDQYCGRCQKCSNYKCQNQSASEDIKQECYPGPCDTGFCNGSGDCAHYAKGAVYCDGYRLVTCSGGESFTEVPCEHNCLPICKPTDSSCRGTPACNECTPGLGFSKCVSSTSVAQCGSNGRWLPGTACPSGKTCSGDEFTGDCYPK